jgi:23S rRNA (cytosine1962-C5)-methyltransferase
MDRVVGAFASLPSEWARELGDDREVFERLAAAVARRGPLLHAVDVTAWRLVHGRADGFDALSVDVYNDVFVVEAHLERSASKAVARVLSRLLPVGMSVVVKERWRRDPANRSGACVAGQVGDPVRIVREEGLLYEVAVIGGEHTGLFLDARSARRRLAKRSSGRRVLNLFCYTGALGVAAASGGCRASTNVDVRSTHEDRVRRNYELNHFRVDSRVFIKEDAARFLKKTFKSSYQFDIIVLDPPRWARTTSKRSFCAATNYGALLRAAFAVLSEDGVVLAGNGAGTFHHEGLTRLLEASAEAAGRRLSFCEAVSPDPDFPEASDRPTGHFAWAGLGRLTESSS